MELHILGWVTHFLGRLHPLLVHFPIGLLVVALFLETLTLNGKRPGLREGINWLIYIGALSALASALLGYLLYQAEDYQGQTLDFHLAFGLLTAILSLLTASLLYRQQQNKFPKLIAYRSSLVLTVLCLTIAGHLGANLTHGENYLSETLPWNNGAYDKGKTADLLAEFTSADTAHELSTTQKDRLNLEVRAIFAHNCYQCHSELKQKGKLVLETKEGVMRGGESGKLFVAGNSEQSEIIRRLKLPRGHEEAMPGKGKALTKEQIKLISLWIDEGAHWADASLKVFPEAELALRQPELPPSDDPQAQPIDLLMNEYYSQHNISAPQLVNDRIFIRRAYLDVLGLLPKPQQVQDFAQSTQPDKRARLVAELLTDSTNYTQHWLSFWNDLLRNDYSGTGFITGGRKQITDWLYSSLYQNKAYDLMVKELTNPTEASEGFIKGIQWRGVVNASQRTEMQAAQNISQSLMGINLKCASCHNSFVSNVTLKQAYGFANIFADSTLEIYRCDKPTGQMSQVEFIYPELGEVEAASLKDKLKSLSEIITQPENGRLYRTITNRIWHRLMGRGIVEPLDEMDNTPWNADLLDWLSADLIHHNYDLKHLIYRIMTSSAYQSTSSAYERLEALRSDDYLFKGPVRRRLSAEQFADAISQTIAPVYYATAYEPSAQHINAAWIWAREVEVERDVLPKPGKRYFRYAFNLPLDKEVASAEVLLTADHSFSFYMNTHLIGEASDWRKVQSYRIEPRLKAGANIIAVKAENEGKVANPAGLLFALKITYADGSEDYVMSDKDWKVSKTEPKMGWTEVAYDDIAWENVKEYRSDYWGKLINFSFDQDEPQAFARASMVKLDPFLKALGRPSRENVTTSRDDQATLLQALELTNGDFFNNIMKEGAERWLAQYGHNHQLLVEQLYLQAFGRKPTEQEQTVLIQKLNEKAPKEPLQDILWASVLLPEFQFIY